MNRTNRTKVYVSIEDGYRQLVIDGPLDLLKAFLETMRAEEPRTSIDTANSTQHAG